MDFMFKKLIKLADRYESWRDENLNNSVINIPRAKISIKSKLGESTHKVL